MKKNNAKLIFILSIITTLLSVSVLVFFIKTIKTKNEYAGAVNSTVENKIADSRNLNISSNEFNWVQSLHETINGYFINSNKAESFIDYLNKLGIDNNTDLKVKGIRESLSDKNKVVMDLSINGKFTNVMQIISLLENAPYSINVNSVYLNKEQSKTPTWQADVSFEILNSIM